MKPNQFEAGSLNYEVPELAEQLGISRNSLYKAIKRGQVPCIRLGGRIILPRPAIDEWLRSAGPQPKDKEIV
jgi:excisionase family DNA binding protein